MAAQLNMDPGKFLLPGACTPLLLASVALIVFLYRSWTRVSISDGMLTLRTGRKVETLALANLAQIKYHYEAVVGFVAVWEFIDTAGHSLFVDAQASPRLLPRLQEVLPGVDLAHFDAEFKAGDVTDCIDVWPVRHPRKSDQP